MAKKDYESRTEAMLMPIVETKGFELVDVEWVKEGANWYLRAYIDKEGGIAVDDCEVISRALSDRMDEEDFIEEAYILEVSSPGLGRPLKKDNAEPSAGIVVSHPAIDSALYFSGLPATFFSDKTCALWGRGTAAP